MTAAPAVPRTAPMTATRAPLGAPGSAEASGGQQEQQKLTFAVALKNRHMNDGSGLAVAAAGAAAASPSSPLMERGAIIGSLAAGFEAALRLEHGVHASADLKTPDYILVVEVLPVGGAAYAALCALPRRLCALKPRMHIRAVGTA